METKTKGVSTAALRGGAAWAPLDPFLPLGNSNFVVNIIYLSGYFKIFFRVGHTSILIPVST